VMLQILNYFAAAGVSHPEANVSASQAVATGMRPCVIPGSLESGHGARWTSERKCMCSIKRLARSGQR
jgi:hypothetical protein